MGDADARLRVIADALGGGAGLAHAAVAGWDSGAASLALGVPIPRSLHRAIAKRQSEFVIGRYCAARALAKLEPRRRPVPLGIGRDRSPQWPEGIVGSITHCKGYAAAVVASRKHFRGVGRDTEVILDERGASDVQRLAAHPGEGEHVGRRGRLEPLTALTLVFSAKESLFKCLYPTVGTFFDFNDAAVVEATPGGRFRILLLRTLGPELPEGRAFEGRFRRTGRLVHTLCVWGPGAPAPAMR